MNWNNLYADRDGVWLKGNLHMHLGSRSSRIVLPPQEYINRYIELDYDFISISSHMAVTELQNENITLIPGLEWNSAIGEHTGIHSLDPSLLKKTLGISEHNRLLEHLSGTDALVILNHPNWLLTPHYRRETLLSKNNYQGLEIYNGVVERQEGAAISTDKWDYLLNHGKRVFGFSNDDSHLLPDIGRAFNMVRAKSNTATDIFQALKSGNFYASSGATIDDIRRTRNIIELETQDAQEIKAVVDGGRVIARVTDCSIKMDVSELDYSYIRFEIYSKGAAKAWTQPFFLK